jgi:pyruvate/2-oxoacid:ferredoxin oxidoreductase alpha subunit
MVVLDAFYLSHTYEPVDVPEPEEADRFLPPTSRAFSSTRRRPALRAPRAARRLHGDAPTTSRGRWKRPCRKSR